jgi:hypothetical protein
MNPTLPKPFSISWKHSYLAETVAVLLKSFWSEIMPWLLKSFLPWWNHFPPCWNHSFLLKPFIFGRNNCYLAEIIPTLLKLFSPCWNHFHLAEIIPTLLLKNSSFATISLALLLLPKQLYCLACLCSNHFVLSKLFFSIHDTIPT